MTSWCLAALLALATLGEGGGDPTALLVLRLGVAALFVSDLVRRPEPQGRGLAPGPAWGLAAVGACLFAGAVAAPYRYGAWLVVLDAAAMGVVLVVAARRGAAALEAMAAVLPPVAALQGIVALVQRAALGDARPAGTFLNPNHLAAWTVAALCLAGATGRVAPARRLGNVLLALPAMAALALTGSRGAVLAVAAALAAAWLMTGTRARDGRPRWVALAAALLLASVLAGGIAWRFRWGEQLLWQRASIWSASLTAAAASPWSGTGPGQFAAAAANLNFPIAEGPLRYERSFTTPHSDLVRLPAELGWPATFAALLTLVVAAVHVARRRDGPEAPPWWAAAALAALLAQAAVDDLTPRPALALLGAALAGGLLSVERPRRPAVAPAIRAALAMAVVHVVALGEVAPWVAWRILHSLPRGRLEAGDRARLETAARLQPIHPDVWLRMAEDAAGDGSAWSLDAYVRAREWAERAVRLSPGEARYHRGLARIEALACRTLFRDEASRERASRAYRAAHERARHDPFLPLEQARFLLLMGDAGGARRAAERALQIEPQAVAPRVTLAAALSLSARADDVGRARRELDRAREIAARWVRWPKDTAYARGLLDLETHWIESVERGLASAGAAVASPPSSP